MVVEPTNHSSNFISCDLPSTHCAHPQTSLQPLPIQAALAISYKYTHPVRTAHQPPMASKSTCPTTHAFIPHTHAPSTSLECPKHHAKDTYFHTSVHLLSPSDNFATMSASPFSTKLASLSNDTTTSSSPVIVILTQTCGVSQSQHLRFSLPYQFKPTLTHPDTMQIMPTTPKPNNN